jgi:putative FmdB family regulatory protein
VPLYEYRCKDCGVEVTALRPLAESQASLACETCGGTAERVLSAPSVHRSSLSKVERLDPRYDRMVDKAMNNTRAADPDRLLAKMKPFPKD